MTNIWAATRRALKRESLENPGRLPRGGGIGTGPWLIKCLSGRDEPGIFSGRNSRSRGSEMVKACSVREDSGIVVRITEGAGRKTEAQRGEGICSKQVSLR